MGTVKLNISLDDEVADQLRRRAAESNQPASRYLAGLIRDDVRRHRDELAVEGYRHLARDTADFARAAESFATETWPEWDPEGSAVEQEARSDGTGS